MPSGLDAGTLQALTGETGPDAYSRPSHILYSATNPYILLPYAEVEFLTAEAIERGWASGDAQAAYEAGQAAAISQLDVNTVHLQHPDQPSALTRPRIPILPPVRWMTNWSRSIPKCLS